MNNKINNPFAEHVLAATGKIGFEPLNVTQLFNLNYQAPQSNDQNQDNKNNHTANNIMSYPTFFMFLG